MPRRGRKTRSKCLARTDVGRVEGEEIIKDYRAACDTLVWLGRVLMIRTNTAHVVMGCPDFTSGGVSCRISKKWENIIGSPVWISASSSNIGAIFQMIDHVACWRSRCGCECYKINKRHPLLQDGRLCRTWHGRPAALGVFMIYSGRLFASAYVTVQLTSRTYKYAYFCAFNRHHFNIFFHLSWKVHFRRTESLFPFSSF